MGLAARCALALTWSLWAWDSGAATGPALAIELEGAIGPAAAAYVEGAIDSATAEGAPLLVLRLDTPGGLDSSMRSIVKSIAASPVPVIGFVAPTGARAASAGTYILYACPVAAMAPGTNLGAATPVELSALPGAAPEPAPGPGQGPGLDSEQGPAQDRPGVGAPADPKTRKLVNDAAAYLRGLAELNGRNADWAERAVREGASLSAEEALRLGVVDLIAPDLTALLKALDGRPVRLPQGTRRLATAGIPIELRAPDWKTRLLAVIGDPNIAYILMLLGVYGLIFEFSNPGTVLPGTLGALFLLLALYAFQLLPVSYAGVGLIALGLALMIGEAFAPSFGALGLGGVAAFVAGSLILMDTQAPGFGISLPLILGFAVTSALGLFFLSGMALTAWRRPVTSGAEELIGAPGVALSGFPGSGSVRLHGEVWSARSAVPIPPGTAIRVSGRDGLTLLVEPGGDR
jgi:membrane-bound serine protease (ClpP class)